MTTRSRSVRLLVLLAVTSVSFGGVRGSSARSDASCTRTSAKAAILASLALKALWPTLRFGGGVDKLICHDFTHDRRSDMAVTVFSGGTAGDTAWLVFRQYNGGWQLALRQLHAYKVGLFRAGNDLIESQPIYLKGDPNCCPTGGFDHRRFHCNGRRFTITRSWHNTTFEP